MANVLANRVGWCFLALQALWFMHEQLGASRYFCWAPLHEHVWYRIDAEHNGRQLTDAEVTARYDRRGAFLDASSGEHWELNAAQHVLDTVRWHEQSLPVEQRARVTVSYRRNHHEARTWSYAP